MCVRRLGVAARPCVAPAGCRIRDEGHWGWPSPSRSSLGRGLYPGRSSQVAPSREPRSGGAGITLQAAIQQYTAWKRAAGAPAPALRAIGGAQGDSDAVSAGQSLAFLVGDGPLTADRSVKRPAFNGFCRYALRRRGRRSPPTSHAARRRPAVHLLASQIASLAARGGNRAASAAKWTRPLSRFRCSCCIEPVCGLAKPWDAPWPHRSRAGRARSARVQVPQDPTRTRGRALRLSTRHLLRGTPRTAASRHFFVSRSATPLAMHTSPIARDR